VSAWYLDSSAIVKFAVEEPESAALQAWRTDIAPDVELVTSELAITEVLRAVARVDGDLHVARAHLDSLDHLVLDRDLLLAAAGLVPTRLRTLDAIHLAAAMTLGDDLAGIITYDERMADAAASLALTPVAPGRDPAT
jgi:predicted nucleic acid-binding protein